MSVLLVVAAPLEATHLHSLPATVIITGIGAVNTAHALTRQLFTQPRPSLVIQTGVGGAYVPSHVGVGSCVLANEEVYADVGVMTKYGWLSTEDMGIPLAPATPTRPARFNHFPLDRHLVRRAAVICGPALAGTGRFLTVSQVTGIRAHGDELHERFGALCESMEGAAAAHVCALCDVPFLEVRGISNLIEDRDRASWRLEEAAHSAQLIVHRLVDHLSDLVAPYRL